MVITLPFTSVNSNYLSFLKRFYSFLFTLLITFFLIQIGNVISNNCGSDQFSCANGECIPLIYHCNNHPECSDKSDEINCSSVVCEFRCDEHNCINLNWVCDNEYDCFNRKDELNCPPRNCTDTEFMCKDKSKCIALKLKCDRTQDCSDGSDEINCTVCNEKEFKCNDGKCIYKHWQCDSHHDCNDMSDELNCPIDNCKENEFKCKSDNKCIPKIYVCDDHNDCKDKSDEPETCHKSDSNFLTKCETHQFLCDDRSQCINSTYKCDSTFDCRDGSDELNCSCSDNEFRCSDSCFPNSFKCNGIKECIDGSDELNCTLSLTQAPTISPCSINEFKCQNNRCIEKGKYCDHIDDCNDNSDEPIGCDTNICQTDKHDCSQNCHWEYNHKYKCSCQNGYKLMEDNRTCNDIDECKEILGICSGHNCINTLGHYKCHCLDGYELYDHRSCRIKGNKPTSLIFANKRDIRLLKLSNNHLDFLNYSPLYEDIRALAIDFNLKHNYIVFSNLENLYIGRLDNSTISFAKDYPSLLIKRDMGNIVCLAVDWIHDLIYWADNSFHTIEVVHAQNNTKSKVLFKNVLEKVTSIAIDIHYSLLFWTCKNFARIERSSQDGSDRKILIDIHKFSPNTLTIDIVIKKLYWFHHLPYLLYSMDYNGRDQKIAQSPISQPAFIDVFGGYLFYSEPHNNAIMKIDLVQDQTRHPKKIVDAESPIGLKIVNSAKQPILDNKCLKSQCGELCLPSNSSFHLYICVSTNHLNELNTTIAISKGISENHLPVKGTIETAKNSGNQIRNESQTTIITQPVEGYPIDGNEDLAFMIIAICLTVVLFILTLLILIYRSYQRRGVTSMNFDNPVYRKTTEDYLVLEKSDEGVDTYATRIEPLNTSATNEFV